MLPVLSEEKILFFDKGFVTLSGTFFMDLKVDFYSRRRASGKGVLFSDFIIRRLARELLGRTFFQFRGGHLSVSGSDFQVRD